MQDEAFAIYAPRKKMLLLALAGLAVAGLGFICVCAPAGARPLEPLHAWAALIAGSILGVSGLKRALFPLPIITIDTEHVVVRRFCMPKRTIRLSDIQEIIVFRTHGVRQLGIRLLPTADRGAWKWIGTPGWNKFVLGAPVDYVIPSAQCGGRLDEAADAIARVSDVPITRMD